MVSFVFSGDPGMKRLVDRWTGLIALSVTLFLLPGCVPTPVSTQYTLTVTQEGEGTINNTGGTYDAGKNVLLVATPAQGWTFSSWQGDDIGANSHLLVVMNKNKSVKAVFSPIETSYTLTVAKEGEGTLNTTGGTYATNEQATLIATPAEGWYFYNWTGDLPDSIDPEQKNITLPMNSNKELNAVFKANPKVLLETSLGNIKLELNMDKAPATVKNFLRYVNEGFFDGQDNKGATIFHRVIADFMIQGGGMTSDLQQKENHDPIVNESNNGLVNDKYTLAMARTNDPNSATSQFFINVKDNDFLNYQNAANPGYAVFGKVIEGTDVVDAIAAVATHTVAYHENVPVTPVTITRASVVE